MQQSFLYENSESDTLKILKFSSLPIRSANKAVNKKNLTQYYKSILVLISGNI
ncbi:hypothetical protein GWE_02985 [Chlamydia psittaci NJ1]|uniref:Uncharacterized protein n=1 Tax=Chlamydia psittaci 99DC5 TaxID=1112251 RepID=A0ABN0MQG6_CHLPS|nr:hypothetical protein B595_0991 [Chlamydia psittaci 84/55]AFS20994.1 hypothetical protein B598_0924 [Chlamydia psittaci GR9]AFS21929.1 hypothetical protein B599_0925 [Chlamydia psittaci MN]AFS23127.1 hypothetical protein B600_0985 [Chlamydia psittaci VS225]AFS23769.1 hypothetical protein B601_0930 [Chlamydia psittaci WS/RT/E30]AFS25502.1 hypothetical protein B603_0930 [Chlamydia psittaci WC]AFS27373.1 hypothetical protein B711_0988 [Chlamydia psittaci CP3]AFS28429.1 hypothetical protein B7